MKSLEDRFWAMVDKQDKDTCWTWLGQTQRRKDNLLYGLIRIGKKKAYAHRVSFLLHNGRWPANGLVARHTCDNSLCVNPCHIIEGTQGDNIHDAQERGRLAYGDRNAMARAEVRIKLTGENNPSSKLSRTDVDEIRSLHCGGVTNAILSKQFGVSRSQITHITKRYQWK